MCSKKVSINLSVRADAVKNTLHNMGGETIINKRKAAGAVFYGYPCIRKDDQRQAF